jgi:CheY-like chemotaxis protein
MIEMVGKKVLIVDDDLKSTKLMRMLIGNSDCIETASDGREGLNKIKEQCFDLIISDVHMPEMNGIEMYKEAIKTDPDIKNRLLFFSATCNPDIINFFEEHNLFYMGKPSPVNKIRYMAGKIISTPRDASQSSVGGLP